METPRFGVMLGLIMVPLLVSGCALKPAGEKPARDTTPFSFVGRVRDDALTEVSGVTTHTAERGSYWVHNDSGGLPRVFEVLPGESVVRAVSLMGARAVDWEDLDRAPCGEDPEGYCLYVADIGDNDARRQHVSIYRVRLDPIAVSLDDAKRTLATHWDRVDFRYPDGPRNAETLMVHPRTLEMYVLEKTTAHAVNLYRVPREFGRNESVKEARLVGTVNLPRTHPGGWTVTAGDFSPDGRTATLLAYEGLLSLCVAYDDVAVFDLESVAEPGPRVPMEKPEALTHLDEPGALVATGEGRHPPFYRLREFTPCGR